MDDLIAVTATKENGGQKNRCLSCGTMENMARKRYCSVECRRRLRQKLDQRTGLLVALNIRYATFYFTDAAIVTDLLPYHGLKIYSFIFPRSDGRPPADDYSLMADVLGNAWWAEKRRTNKHYLASRFVLDQSERNRTPVELVKPLELRIPSLKGRPLHYLKIGEKELIQPNVRETIKRAYRQQAMRHHPDRGGSAEIFVKIQTAYETLIEWAGHPTFIHRRGFPDKWFYEGCRNCWTPPIPMPKPPCGSRRS